MKRQLKKIAWIKYTGTIEIGTHLLFTAGTTDLRTRFLRQLLRNNVCVQFYTNLTRESLKYVSSDEGQTYFEGRYNKQVKHMFDHTLKDIDPTVDLLIVESGPDNAMFSVTMKDLDASIPSAAYTNALVSSYKGLVFYWQVDLALCFPFFPEFYSNKYTDDGYLDFGTSKTLFNKKKWVCMFPAKDVKPIPEKFDTPRCHYNKLFKAGLIQMERFEFHYCGIDFDEQQWKPRMKAQIIGYVGGERARFAKFAELYHKPALFHPVLVYGKWKEETQSRLPQIQWGGILERGKQYEFYNKCFGSIIIGDKNYEKVGCVSGRFFEVVMAATLPMIDKDLIETTISDIFDKKLIEQLVVKSEADVMRMYKNLQGSIARVDLITECQRQMQQHSPQNTIDELFALFDKYESSATDTLGNKKALTTVHKQVYNERIQKFGKEDSLTAKAKNYMML